MTAAGGPIILMLWFAPVRALAQVSSVGLFARQQVSS